MIRYSSNIKFIKIFVLSILLIFSFFNLAFSQETAFLRKDPSNRNIKDTYILFDCLYDTEVESIDSYSLFLKMKEKGINAYYVLLKNTKLYDKLASNNQLNNIIALDSNIRHHPKEFISKITPVLHKTKAIITSFEIGTKLDYLLNSLHNIPYIFIQHGQIFFKESILFSGYLNNNLFDKILISSESEASILKRYGWTDKQFIKSGLSRWDLLNDNKNSERSILIMFTWRQSNPKIFAETLYFKKLYSLINSTDLVSYLESKNVKLYFSVHHALKEVANVNLKIEHPYIEIVDPLSVSEYIKKSSLLLTDFSSVLFDFMFQNKPVVLYGLDRGDKLLTKDQFIDMELLKEKQSTFPNIFFDEKEVVDKIKYYVERDFIIEPEISDIYNKFFFIKNNIRDDLIRQLEEITR